MSAAMATMRVLTFAMTKVSFAMPRSLFLAMSCWRSISVTAFQFFRYGPEGDYLVLAHDVERAYTRSYGDLRVRFEGLRPFAP
jgi:hypothetical protein